MKKHRIYKTEIVLFAVLAILIGTVAVRSVFSRDSVYYGRDGGRLSVVEDVHYTQRQDADAPTGVVTELRFTLDDIAHADTLSFYITHYDIAVWLADECVYSHTAWEDTFRTCGGVWVMVPLLAEDSGKEVRIVLAPLYKNYQDQTPELLLGSGLAIFQSVFYQAIPELIMSLCIVLTGLFLFALAVYQMCKRRAQSRRLFSIALLAVSAGVWRFTYGSFAYLLFGEHAVAVYTVSVIALMLVALAMLNCADTQGSKRVTRMVHLCSALYTVIYIVQLVLQSLGVLDLRNMLTLTHVTIVFSAAVLCIGDGVVRSRRYRAERGGRNYSWILGVGAIIDLLLYYFTDTNIGLLCTLGGILCFSLLEGANLLFAYTRQQNAFEELKTQLALSRTTTLMSQIRSHFVFNILNAISGMCKYDPEKADETVVRFARYLRNNIDIMEDDKPLPFSVELARLEDYVLLEQVRFGDKIAFCTDIEVDDFLIPPLILQPVLENAIKHGLAQRQEGGTLTLRTREDEGSVKIIVEDDGVGFSPSEAEKEHSVGLKNIRYRLHHLVGGTLDIASEVGVGTVVTITVPKKGAVT